MAPPVVSWRTEVELESSPASAPALEELSEWVPSAPREAPLVRVATLPGHRVVWIIAVVEALTKLRVGQNLIRFVHRRHLRF